MKVRFPPPLPKMIAAALLTVTSPVIVFDPMKAGCIVPLVCVNNALPVYVSAVVFARRKIPVPVLVNDALVLNAFDPVLLSAELPVLVNEDAAPLNVEPSRKSVGAVTVRLPFQVVAAAVRKIAEPVRASA